MFVDRSRIPLSKFSIDRRLFIYNFNHSYRIYVSYLFFIDGFLVQIVHPRVEIEIMIQNRPI